MSTTYVHPRSTPSSSVHPSGLESVDPPHKSTVDTSCPDPLGERRPHETVSPTPHRPVSTRFEQEFGRLLLISVVYVINPHSVRDLFILRDYHPPSSTRPRDGDPSRHGGSHNPLDPIQSSTFCVCGKSGVGFTVRKESGRRDRLCNEYGVGVTVVVRSTIVEPGTTPTGDQ